METDENINGISSFPATYIAASLAYSITDQGRRHLWLKKKNGVVSHLKTYQRGFFDIGCGR